ncbi:MAG TPA: helix-turn-helix transcriptional regulator, partial [Thermoanaerobaculia bacterium]|nr:helix-turn-helix transcriptional regulator [Thermoanaerobaculia bacterium]
MSASETSLLERIARNLRALRESHGLTREQLAAATSVDAQMIKRIEAGRANPALVVLSRLAAAMTISLSVMLAADAGASELTFVTDRETEAFEAEEVGETLGALRRRQNVSQRELARIVDLRTSTIHR